MVIQDNILKNKLKNVYFIWGSGKTTAANYIGQKYGYYVYHTDNVRGIHFKNADPEYQPEMCRNVPDFWALPPEEAVAWETAIVREFTPMIVADLIELSALHETVICEGDIDIDAVIPIASHVVTISNYGKATDFFERPEQSHMLEESKNRPDLTDSEREKLIENAYKIVGYDPKNPQANIHEIPYETKKYGVKQIIRDDHSTPSKTAAEIEQYFGFMLRF